MSTELFENTLNVSSPFQWAEQFSFPCLFKRGEGNVNKLPASMHSAFSPQIGSSHLHVDLDLPGVLSNVR